MSVLRQVLKDIWCVVVAVLVSTGGAFGAGVSSLVDDGVEELLVCHVVVVVGLLISNELVVAIRCVSVHFD